MTDLTQRLYILMILLAAALCAGAQAGGRMKFRHYDTSSGLPSNCIRDIAQDRRGFVWLATDGGLVRCDGTRFRTFAPDSLDVSGRAAGRYAMSIAVLGDTLLVGTDRGLQLYDPVMERLTQIALVDSKGAAMAVRADVRDVLADSRGRVWLAIDGSGVWLLDSGLTVRARHDLDGCQGYVAMLMQDRDGAVWAVTKRGPHGLYRYDEAKGRFEPFDIKIGGKRVHAPAQVVYQDKDGTCWLGTWERGLLRFDPRTGEAVTAAPGLRHLHSMTEGSDGSLLVGSGMGLVQVNPADGTHQIYSCDELDPFAISDQFVYPLLRDREGGLWAGTFYRGVNYAVPGSERFSEWRPSRFVNSVSGHVISAIAADGRGNVWTGSADGGLGRMDLATQRFESVSIHGLGQTPNVHALCIDGDRLWVGGYAGQAGWVDLGDCSWHPVGSAQRGSTNIYALFRSTGGTVWAGEQQWLTRYDPASDSLRRVRDLGRWVSHIAEDCQGRLWIATQGRGVYRYDPRTHEWVHHRPGNGLSHAHVNHLCVAADGRVWISTYSGLDVYDPRTRLVSPSGIDTRGAMVESVTEHDGVLWVSTSDGLLCCDPSAGAAVPCGADAGLLASQFQPGAVCVCAGRLWLGSVTGLCAVDMTPMAARSEAAPVVLTGVEVGGRECVPGDRWLASAPDRAGTLRLDAADDSFAVSFSRLAFAPAASRLQYRLDGLDREWTDAPADGRVSYAGLGAGRYTLRVRDGAGGAERVLTVIVAPRWYATWWWRVACGVLFSMLLAWGSRLYFSRRSQSEHDVPQTGVAVTVAPPAPEAEPAEADPDFLAQLNAVIGSHMADTDLGVETVMAEMNVGRSTLYNKVKALTGMGLREFINDTRLKQAARLLREDGLSVSEVSERVGFKTLPHFSRSFQRQFGVSPLAWMNQE